MDIEATQGRRWSALEEDLRKIPGTLRVRIEGEEAPTQVHLVVQAPRRVDEVSQAVRTVAAASGIDLSDETLSIVQLEADIREPEEIASHPAGGRIILESVVVATKPSGGWAKLNLRMPNGEVREGAAPISPSKDARARAGVSALIDALQEPVAKMNTRLELKNLFVHDMYQDGFIVVQVAFGRNGDMQTLTGSAAIGDDMAAAGAKAALHALNRRLQITALGNGNAV